MELLLNLVWLCIGGIALWRFLGTTAMDRKQFLFALVALSCAILLLFPTVSVSDDLHVQAFVTEDANASKRLLSAAVQAIPIGFCGMLLAGFLLTAMRRTLWLIRRMKSVLVPTLLCERPVLGRAPPALVLA